MARPPLALNETEQRFAAVKSIDEAPDWSVNAPATDHPEVVRARGLAGGLLTSSPGSCGLIMRGMLLAIADHFPPNGLEKGMASTMRGARNAFAERKIELYRAAKRKGD